MGAGNARRVAPDEREAPDDRASPPRAVRDEAEAIESVEREDASRPDGGPEPAGAASVPMPEPPPWTEGVPVATAGITRLGTLVVGGFMAALVAWGGLMPLDSAVVMPGSLVPAGRHQKVQHDVGGRVLAILRRDGERVAAGEIILRLDPIERRAAMTELRARRARLAAMRDRLRAASAAAGVDDASAPWALRGAGVAAMAMLAPAVDVPLAGAMRDAQLAEFRAGRARIEREVEGLRAKGEGLARQREGLGERIAAQERLRDLVRGDIAKLGPLAERGLIARRRVDDLRRSLAEMDARIEGLRAELRAKLAQGTEVAAAIGRAREGDREQLAERLTRVLGELAETEDRLAAARQAVERSDIRAPVAGTLVKATQTTPGGVVAPGEVVAEIVPEGTPLVAEGRARPDDVASLAIGQEAEILITALRDREPEPIPARVVYVAADTTRDGEDGEPYYTVRLALEPTGPVSLRAGMQAELYARGHARPFLAYLLEPLTGSLSRAFREE